MYSVLRLQKETSSGPNDERFLELPKTDKFPRLLNLVMLLLDARKPLSLDEIARRIGGFPESPGARRQAFERAKKELRDLGIPIQTRQIAGGEQYGYLIDQSEMIIPDLRLSHDEAAALAAASGMVSFDNSERNSALSKLGCVISGQDATLATLPSQPKLHKLFKAIGSNNSVAFSYRSRVRDLDIYGISFKWGNWYLIGRERDSGQIKTFLVNRIESSITLTGAAMSTKPSGFDLNGYLPKNRWEIGEGAVKTALVKISTETVPLIQYDLKGQGQLVHEEDGTAVLSAPVVDRNSFFDWLLSYADQVQLLGTSNLVDGFTSYLQNFIDYSIDDDLENWIISEFQVIDRSPTTIDSKQQEASSTSSAENADLNTAGSKYVMLAKILPWLARIGTTTVSIIASTFGISDSDVVRLLEMAACCGVPPYTPDALLEIIVDDDGTVMSFLDMELITAPRTLNTLEVMVLATTASVALEIPGIDPNGHLQSALVKLQGSLSEFKRGLAEVSVDVDEPYFLETLRDAANASSSVKISYFSFSSERISTRVVDPYLVFMESGKWYMRGFCHLAGEIRHFAVGRVLACENTELTFQIPEIEREWIQKGVPPHAFREDGEWVDIVVPEDLAWIVNKLVAFPRIRARRDGYIVYGFLSSSQHWLSSLMLRLGPRSYIIQPAHYRDLGRQIASEILKKYQV